MVPRLQRALPSAGRTPRCAPRTNRSAATSKWHDLCVADIPGTVYARDGRAQARCARLGDRTIVWTHVQFAVTEFGSPLIAMDRRHSAVVYRQRRVEYANCPA